MRPQGFFKLASSFGAGLILWMAIILCPSRAVARETGPRLNLPGGCLVHAGEVVDLQWSAADSISELEIMLSLDGGRHYVRCISPELDPHRSHFLWRVPELGSRMLRMRIRFNRGGREIEGAPTPPLLALSSGELGPEPLGLPPLPGGHEPQTGGSRTETLSERSFEARQTSSPRPADAQETEGLGSPPPDSFPHESALARTFTPPRSIPLRA
jgi:hypothetical protein